MVEIKHDKYTGKYFFSFSESNVVALTFEEMEELGEQIKQMCTDVYSQALQLELDLDSDGCESGACKI